MAQPSAKRQKVVSESVTKDKSPSVDENDNIHEPGESVFDGFNSGNDVGEKKSSASPPTAAIRNRPKLPPLSNNKYSRSLSSPDEDVVSEGEEDEKVEDYEEDGDTDRSDNNSDYLDEDENPNAEENAKRKVTKPKQIATKQRLVVEGCNYNLKPLSGIPEIFGDLTENAVQMGLFDFIKHMNGNALKVGTFCSGTESPILALKESSKALERDHGKHFPVQHMFSAENVPFKQAYIQENFNPPILYRDITEFGGERGSEVKGPLFGTTAFGTRIEVPGSIDLLVAGTCCHDFSMLNGVRKRVESNGESGQTFFATLAYMEVYRPKIVIFENVSSAPFLEAKVKEAQKEKGHHALDFYINQKGYATRLIRTDARDYYMPHTRQRGYMICIEERQAYLSLCPNAMPNPSAAEIKTFSEDGLIAYFDDWAKIVKSLARQASVCVEDMLFEEDDTRLAILRQTEKEQKARKKHTWEVCATGHLQYRSFHRLGDSHFVTQWHGEMYKLPDHYVQHAKGFTQRVLDFIDICHLKNLLRGFDDRYCSRNLELSQNVYRVEDSAKNGVVGCLMPSGFPFSTTLGRKINGVEAMGLQAMATADLNLVHQTQEDLQDMAGNAMTSTVVGAVMLAGLTIFYKMFERGAGVVQKLLAVEPMLDDEQSLVQSWHDPTSYQKLSVADAMSFAALTRRLCPCEESSLKFYQQCKICKHTACNICGGNPKHDYIEIPRQIIKSRKDPSSFHALLWKSIPRKLSLLQLPIGVVESSLQHYQKREKCSGSIDSNTWASTYKFISKALCSELCLRGINRNASSWEATYDSPEAKAELKISRYGVEWLVYVNASDMPSATYLGAHFRKFPFLRMVPNVYGNDLIVGQWQIWHPKESSFDVNLRSSGSLIPTYLCSAGLIDHCNDYTPSEIEITVQGDSEIAGLYSGKYMAAPSCGQAFNSTYFRVGTDGLATTELFYLDQGKAAGNPESFSFIFTGDSSRVKPGTHRRHDARMESTWRPHLIKLNFGDQDLSSGQCHSGTSHLFTYGSWTNFSGISVGTTRRRPIEYRQLLNPTSTVYNSCAHQHAVFICNITLMDSEISFLWPRNEWINIDKSKSALFKRNFAWAVQNGFEHPEYSQGNENWHDADIQASAKCPGCSPVAPSKLWAMNKMAKMAPFEEPSQACIFEMAMKAVPQPLATCIFISSGRLTIKIGMNPSTLIHRAAARLAGPSEIKSYWLLVTDDRMARKPMLAPLSIKSSHDEIEAPAPPNFLCRLRPEQLRALGWMMSQENDGKVFLEESISEQCSSSTNMRLWGKATREAPVKGGILAFEVGFGKTVVTVGLVASQRQLDLEWPRQRQDGLIPLKATLVYVPMQLTAQWKTEIEKFAGDCTFTIVVLDNIKHLGKTSIGTLEEADFIIVSMDICGKQTYRTRLAYFSGMVEHDDNATPLAKSEWYNSALPYVGKSVNKLRNDPAQFNDYLGSTYKTNLKDVKANTPTIPCNGEKPSQTGKKGTHNGLTTDDASRDYTLQPELKDYRDSTLWVFEALSCARVVVDEYTYTWQASTSFSTIKQTALAADKKWMLSGTPALGNFADVRVVASLLGVDLGEDDVSMRGHIDKRHLIEMTMMEEFLAIGQNFSPALKERRHVYAQKFLNVYARKDITEITAIKYSEHLQVLRLTPCEFAINLELAQKMVAEKFNLEHCKSTGSNESQYIRNATAGCRDGREAMVVRASTFEKHIFASELMVDDAKQMTQIIIEARDAEYHVLEQATARLLALATWLDRSIGDTKEKSKVFSQWKERVMGGTEYGEAQVQKAFMNAIDAANAKYRADDPSLWHDGTKGDTRPKKPKGKCNEGVYAGMDADVLLLRESSFKLINLGKDAVKLKRSLRFFKAVRDTEAISTHKLKGLSCSCCDKHTNLQPEELTILSRCGHVVCNFGCLEKAKFSGGICPRGDCNAASRGLQFVSGSDFISTNHSNKVYEDGSKLDHMIRALQLLTEDEKVLIFCQFEKQIEAVKNALRRAAVSFTDLQSDRSSKNLKAFQKQPTIKVLLLNVGDSSAAGSNLTVANHVFFLSPYLTKGFTAQQNYDSTMTQAIGRARRFGQTKHVHVYHILASKTIDIDIIEKRSSKILTRDHGFLSDRSLRKVSAEECFVLVEAAEGETGEFASSAAAEIFSSSSEYA